MYLEIIAAASKASQILVPLIVAGVATSLPFVPKVGIGRAFMLAIRSKFFKPKRLSQRSIDINYIKQAIKVIDESHFIVIRGLKGIGKTCTIQTALSRTYGVIFMSGIGPGKDFDDIMNQALTSITNIRSNWFIKENSAKRVIWFYRTIFRQRLILVMPTNERLQNQKYADISTAARELANLGVLVIVDSSDNSIAHTRTLREIVYEMQPMSDELLISLPQLKELLEYLKKFNLIDVVLVTCGGVPANLESLFVNFIMKFDDESRQAVVCKFVEENIGEAINQLVDFSIKYPKMKHIFNQYKGLKKPILESILVMRAIDNPVLDLKPVLRLVIRRGKQYYIPATGAISVALTAGFEDWANFQQIQNAVKQIKNIKFS